MIMLFGTPQKIITYLCVLVLGILPRPSLSQVNASKITSVYDSITFPEPIGGYGQLHKFLETKISEGDTLGKKHLLQLYNVRYRVNANGIIDSAYIGISHDDHPIHLEVIKHLNDTKWRPATKNGTPISFEMELVGNLYFNKNVYRKYTRRRGSP
jgi:hypothetical protein